MDISKNIGDLLASPEWPEAVPADLICNKASEKQKHERAKNILQYLLPANLSGLRVLDFGCGEGHTTEHASTLNAEFSVGYDNIEYPSTFMPWESAAKHALLTTNYESVQQNGPYDIILMYDVLDHADTHPVELLKLAKSLLKPDGRIFVSCHPFVSRHGSHLYTTLNKAFAHLLLSSEELVALSPVAANEVSQFTNRVLLPSITYSKWFAQAQLAIVDKNIRRDPIEPFFFTPLIKQRIYEHAISVSDLGKHILSNEMSQSFCDFTLQPNDEIINEPDVYVITTMSHIVDRRGAYMHDLLSNGHIGTAESNNLWQLENNTLILKWFDAKRGDYFIDTCTLSDNEQLFRGTNQSGTTIHGSIWV